MTHHLALLFPWLPMGPWEVPIKSQVVLDNFGHSNNPIGGERQPAKYKEATFFWRWLDGKGCKVGSSGRWLFSIDATYTQIHFPCFLCTKWFVGARLSLRAWKQWVCFLEDLMPHIVNHQMPKSASVTYVFSKGNKTHQASYLCKALWRDPYPLPFRAKNLETLKCRGGRVRGACMRHSPRSTFPVAANHGIKNLCASSDYKENQTQTLHESKVKII